MKAISLVLLSVLVFALSCKQGKKENTKSTQMQNVMAIHDEIMPKMGTLAKYTAALKARADTTETGKQYQAAMADLQDAHKSMMDWMVGFGDRFDSDEILNGKELSPQKKEWLNEEEEKVKTMRDQINSSIALAEELLEKH